MKQLRLGTLIISFLLLSGWTGYRLGRESVRPQRINPESVDLGLFWQVWDKLEDSYLIKADLDREAMVNGAIKGMTAALGDPYTVFLPPSDNKESKEELNGEFEGVGIQLGFKEETLAVIAPLSGTPAEAAGARAGDLILHLKDEGKDLDQDTAGLSLPEAVRLIRGPKGTSIELTILREGDSEPVVLTIRRDTIVVKSVELDWTGDNENIAHLKLTRFGGRTEAEWREAVGQVAAKNPRAIILDLRNNPGGYLQGAVDIAGEFLPLGKLVVKQEDGSGRAETYSVDRQGRLLTTTLLVLVNAGSASSSEILAGALKDHGRARLVGETTFGKGTVQEALELPEGAGLHVTTAKWLLPGGLWVNDSQGLKPDVEVADDPKTEVDEQLVKALESL